ncbi:MAG: GH25 family lysozyme [Ginsengibacter sp.]
MARKKRRSILRSVIIIFLSLCFVSLATYYFISFLTRPRPILYTAFGIDIPQGFTIHGIDVSHYQKVIDWSNVKEMQAKNIRIGFVFIKATEGIGKVDADFRRNWLKTNEEKITKGAYHYFIAGKSSNAQAQNFIDIVKLEKGDLPPVLDIEQANGVEINDIRAGVKNWLNKIEQHYKITPIIYTNIDFYKNYLNETFDKYPFWIAHYLQPVRPRLNRKWIFWQHNEKGHVNGIRSTVDFNVFAGDSSDFKKLLIK